jgi:eukaryotic-like serine/threonine-protein kinase
VLRTDCLSTSGPFSSTRTLPLAYAGLGVIYSNLGQAARANGYFKKAFDLREHASERERLGLTTMYYGEVTGELDKAVQVSQEMIAAYPRDGIGYDRLSAFRMQQGRYQEALDVTLQRPQLPGDVLFRNLKIGIELVALQRLREALGPLQEARSRFTAHNNLYAVAFLSNDAAGMAEQQQWFAANPALGNSGLALISDTEAYAGHLRNARELTQRAVDSVIRADNVENGAIFLGSEAIREAAFGNFVQARQSAAEGLKLTPSSWDVQVLAALAYAMSGDDARAQAIAEDVNKTRPLDTQVQSLWLPAIQAQFALNRKDPAAAISSLQSALPPTEYGIIEFTAATSCLYHTYIRGEAYLAAGQGKEAAIEFQKILDHSGIVWNCWTGALARLGVARANALQAKNSTGADADLARTRALAAYQDFLTLWKDADPDIPIYQQAKAERANLH